MQNRMITAACLLMLTAPSLAAQNPQSRSGFWLNLGLGIGSYGCDGCDGRESGGTAAIALGATLSQKVVIGGGVNVWTKEVNGVDLTAGAVTALIRFYPSATGGFFLLGGLGLASEEASASGVSISESGTGAVLGLGYDIRVGSNISITPFWNGVGMSFDGYSSNFGQLGLGLTVH
ncbi:MAG TPA: outer membrane beta-barrel protein [Gemmatimonadales bacterium]|nr:outer membrane beta-barrel protein [Gemmatimonadales bacterium]